MQTDHEPRPQRKTGRRQTIKTVETEDGPYFLERINARYYLRLGVQGTPLRLHPSALRELGAAMLVVGAANEWRL